MRPVAVFYTAGKFMSSLDLNGTAGLDSSNLVGIYDATRGEYGLGHLADDLAFAEKTMH